MAYQLKCEGDALRVAVEAEGGHEIIELAPDGTFKRGFNPPNGHGLKDAALAVDEKFLCVAHDGMAWGDKVDCAKPDWKGTNTVSIIRVDLEKWSIAEFPGNVRHAALKKYDFGPGSEGNRAEDTPALAGLVLVGGRLFVGDAVDGQVLVIDPATAKIERSQRTPAVAVLAQGIRQAPLIEVVGLIPARHFAFAITARAFRINRKEGAGDQIDDKGREGAEAKFVKTQPQRGRQETGDGDVFASASTGQLPSRRAHLRDRVAG